MYTLDDKIKAALEQSNPYEYIQRIMEDEQLDKEVIKKSVIGLEIEAKTNIDLMKQERDENREKIDMLQSDILENEKRVRLVEKLIDKIKSKQIKGGFFGIGRYTREDMLLEVSPLQEEREFIKRKLTQLHQQLTRLSLVTDKDIYIMERRRERLHRLYELMFP